MEGRNAKIPVFSGIPRPPSHVDIVEVVGSSPISSTHNKTGFPTLRAETCFCLQPTESRLLAELSSAGQWFFCLEEAAAYSPRLQPLSLPTTSRPLHACRAGEYVLKLGRLHQCGRPRLACRAGTQVKSFGSCRTSRHGT